MDNVRELMHQRAALLSQARALVDVAENEKRDLNDGEAKQYADFTSQADTLNKRIERQRQLAAMSGGSEPEPARPDPVLGMGAKDVQRYSFTRALLAQANRNWRGAELEREASDATAKALGVSAQGFFVPVDVLAHRELQRVLTPRGWQYQSLRADMTKSPATAGGNLIATDLLAASFIELLRNRMMIQAAGATMLGGLVGDVAIPKQTGGATAYWVADNTDITAESTPTVGQVSLTPKTVGAYTDISRKLLKQSSIDAEMFVRNDLSAVLARAIDLSALHGTGAGNNQPTGIANTIGIGGVFAGGAAAIGDNPNGAAPIWADLINLETEVAADNADIGTLAYMTNARVRGKLKQTAKVAGSDSRMVWDDGLNPLNGYMAHVTNQVSNALTKGAATDLSAIFFGNWADLLLATWGTLDILADPYTGDVAGRVRVIALQDVDVAVRHAESFAACVDVVTA